MLEALAIVGVFAGGIGIGAVIGSGNSWIVDWFWTPTMVIARLGETPRGWSAPDATPLEDVQAAMRSAKADAKRRGYQPEPLPPDTTLGG